MAAAIKPFSIRSFHVADTEWTLVTGKPRHWKWRMRHAPLTLAKLANERLRGRRCVDLILCSDMLDLPAWRGFGASQSINRSESGSAQPWWTKPAVVYFHENQWTYPIAPGARPDSHYGYTNLLTALAAQEVWFNSEFHRRSFLQASQSFVGKMPDNRREHDFESLAHRCRVIAPGFEPVTPKRSTETDPVPLNRPIRLGWVSRWEDDKRPDRLADLLIRLDRLDVSFELILLGGSRQSKHAALEQIEQNYRPRIRFNGYAADRAEYEHWVRQMDVVVSCADHEFFGIAICEAISAGVLPLVPNRLCYPEWIPEKCLYDDLSEAAEFIQVVQQTGMPTQLQQQCRNSIAPFEAETIVCTIDQSLSQTFPPTARDRT